MLLAPLCLSLLGWSPPSESIAQPTSNEPETRYLHYRGDPNKAPGQGRRIVLIAGDEEYRSEEVQPMLARQLHALGFECIVLFSQDPETGEVDPDQTTHIPATEWVQSAELLVLQLRFRALPEEQMKPIVDYIEAGKPVMGLRTSTHAFDYRAQPDSKYAHWSFHARDWPGGFGKQVLGENWVAHHGNHGSEATRALPIAAQAHHAVLRGVGPIFGPSDVYRVGQLPADAIPLMAGQVVAGMSPDDPAVAGEKNAPMMPVVWLRERALSDGEGSPVQRVFTTTMGTADDWSDVDLRRVFLNASLWCLGEEAKIPREGFRAELREDWQPTPFGFGRARTGYKPQDYKLASPWAKKGADLPKEAIDR